MRILRVADVQRSLTAGVSGSLLQGGVALERRGHQVTYLFGRDILGTWVPRRLRRLVVPLAVLLKAHRLGKEGRLDVVELHEHLAAPYALLASIPTLRRRLAPCVVFSHGLIELEWRATLARRAQAKVATSPWQHLSVQATLLAPARLAHRRAAHSLVFSEEERTWLRERAGIPGTKVTVVINGVTADVGRGWRRRGDRLRVLFLGTWLERKGAYELAAAWERLLHSDVRASLTLAGTVLGQDEVREHLPPGGRSDVEVIPHFQREDLPGLLFRHDVLVVPSCSEGMPMAALEGAAAALAVVASEIPGITAVFRPPEPGLDGAILVAPGAVDDLAAAVGRLAADPGLLDDLGRRARARSASFTWERAAERLERAYGQASGLLGTVTPG